MDLLQQAKMSEGSAAAPSKNAESDSESKTEATLEEELYLSHPLHPGGRSKACDAVAPTVLRVFAPLKLGGLRCSCISLPEGRD